MTKIIAIVNQKGGAGKTTTAMQLAAGMVKKGKNVLIVDGDVQGTASRWAATSHNDTGFPATVVNLSHASEKIHREIRNFLGLYDIILVDCPPAADSGVAQSALCVADLALIPMLPSPPDIWASIAIKEVVAKAKIVNEGLEARIVLNQYQPTLTITKEINLLLPKLGIKVFDTKIAQRTSYRESAAIGGSVYDLGTKGKQGCEEFNSLIDEIYSI
jgi:chromosome partitioning protein